MTSTTRRKFLAKSSALAVFSAVPGVAFSANNPLTELSAAEAVGMIVRGDLRAEDYARTLVDRCAQLKDLNAFISQDRDSVLEAARTVDQERTRGKQLGALGGLPIPLKDSIGTTALPTTCGTRSFRPKEDAAVWQRLSEAGAILLGKTNLHEMSLGWTSANQAYGLVRNPYDPRCIPGGSSGGTAVAVSARMAPAGIGETACSVQALCKQRRERQILGDCMSSQM